MLTLADLLEAIIGNRYDWADPVITDAVVDSRQAISGSLFVALPGERFDGHDFVADAFERGAKFALVQEDLSEHFRVLDLRDKGANLDLTALNKEIPETPFCLWVDDSLQSLQEIARFRRRQLDVRVVGITGSVGKSTTKELAAEVLTQRYRTLKNPGNLNNEIGLPLTMLQLSGGHERAVLEMGLYVEGEIAFLCDLALPHIGVVTNVGTVHAERAGSQEAIARGKSELVQALPPAPEGVAVLNYDDPMVRKMAEMTEAQVFFYGLSSEADLWADDVEGLGLEGIRFRLHYQNEDLYVRIPLIGRHSVHTALRASAVGLVEGLTWQEIVAGMRSGHTQLRLVAVEAESGAIILDDTYNASPQSVLAALNLLEEMKGHKIAVLGDMLELGPYEEHGHQMVGIRASEVADEIITVGELARMIAESAVRSGFSPGMVTRLEDTQQAIEFLSDRLTSDDVVLVKGSHGMRMDRIVAALETSE